MKLEHQQQLQGKHIHGLNFGRSAILARETMPGSVLLSLKKQIQHIAHPGEGVTLNAFFCSVTLRPKEQCNNTVSLYKLVSHHLVTLRTAN